MTWRLEVLKEHGLGLKEIQEVISTIDPLPGAREFLDKLRAQTQVIILSDTFEQFAKPLMAKLGWPTLFCNTLKVGPDGAITGYQMRCERSKLTTVKALQSCGFDTIAADNETATKTLQDAGVEFDFEPDVQSFKDALGGDAYYDQYKDESWYDQELLDAILAEVR